MKEILVKNEIKEIALELENAGFEAYLVGGCVRDIFLDKEPKDWDVATNATPEQIQKVFENFKGATVDSPATIYENNFGTVGVKTGSEDETLKIVEITTYRSEGKYTDRRHPDEVRFTENIKDDLSRRDFTVNALAYNLSDKSELNLVDPYGGEGDLKNNLIRAVGEPDKRFQEDALRLMRAIRFMAQLDFTIEEKTREAIRKNAHLLEFISGERIRDELSKMIMTDKGGSAIREMQSLGLLKYVIPELETGVGIGQNKHHIYTVFEHNVKSLDYAVKQNFPLHIRLASLLHDVGKPKSKRGEGEFCTFHGHQVVGEKMALKILDRLHYPKDMIEKIALLVREHMFVYDPDTVTDAGARRLLRRVGQDNIDDLFKLREADRIGSGVPKAQPYRLRHLKFRIEKVSKDPISVKMLKINGDDFVKDLGMEPGPKMGYILAILLEEVLDDPSLNIKESLTARVTDLMELEERKLAEMAKFAKKSADQAQTKVEEDIKKKYFVK